MNRVSLAGRLVADPESIITKTGANVCRISVACNDVSGRKDEVYFFPCVAWESRAKFISTYLKKGSPVVIDGRLQRKSYVNSEGVTIYNTEVVIDNIRSFGSSNNSGNSYNRDNTNFEAKTNFVENKEIKKELNNEMPNFQSDLKVEDNKEDTSADFDLDWLDEIDD